MPYLNQNLCGFRSPLLAGPFIFPRRCCCVALSTIPKQRNGRSTSPRANDTHTHNLIFSSFSIRLEAKRSFANLLPSLIFALSLISNSLPNSSSAATPTQLIKKLATTYFLKTSISGTWALKTTAPTTHNLGPNKQPMKHEDMTCEQLKTTRKAIKLKMNWQRKLTCMS